MGKVQEMNNEIIAKLRGEIETLKYTLSSCRNHAERIIERDYGESMDAHSIVEKVNEVLGER